MEDLVDLAHHLVGLVARAFEERCHQLLPLAVDRFAAHTGERLVERAGRLEIADEESVVAEEQRIVVPSGASQRLHHLRPDGSVMLLVLVERRGLDAEGETHSVHLGVPRSAAVG